MQNTATTVWWEATWSSANPLKTHIQECTPVWLPTCTARSSVERPLYSSGVSGPDVNPHLACCDVQYHAVLTEKCPGAVLSCILSPLKLQGQLGQILNGVQSAICEWSNYDANVANVIFY